MQADLPDGSILAYDVYDFTAPWRQAPTLVLVHGFSKNRRFWYEWIPDLAKMFQVFVVDQRGHGDSSALPENFEMALAPFAEDLRHFLDAVGVQRAHFVMAEFTSSVAVVLAGRYPERVASLTLPGFGYKWRSGSVELGEWVRLLEEEGSRAWAEATVGYRLPADADPGLREWYVSQQAHMDSRVLSKLFRYSATIDLTDALPQIAAPTLILAGGAARQESTENLRVAEAIIADCKLVIFEDMPFNIMTAAPSACVAETIKFIEGVENLRQGA
jgi:3-oxoadipate enol-lactonase